MILQEMESWGRNIQEDEHSRGGKYMRKMIREIKTTLPPKKLMIILTPNTTANE